MNAALCKAYTDRGTVDIVPDLPLPEIKDNEVLIHVRAACITPTDIAFARGELSDITGRPTPRPARVLGTVCSGTVEVAGAGASEVFPRGTNVVAIVPLVGPRSTGVCAEFTAADISNCVPLPASMSFEQAAGAAYAGTTALQILHGKLKLTPGDVMLVTDAASLIGSVISQIATCLYKVTVVAAVYSAEEAEYLANLPQPIRPARIVNISQESILGVVDEETGGIGVQHFVDLSSVPVPDTSASGRVISTQLSPASMVPKRKAMQLLAVHGHWVSFCCDLQLDPPESRLMCLKDATLSFAFGPAWGCSPHKQGVRLHMLQEALKLVSEGTIKVPIADTLYTIDTVNVAIDAALQQAQRSTHNRPPEVIVITPWNP